MFYPVEIDACPTFGWQRGPYVDVQIKTLVSGREKRKPQSFIRKHTFVLPFMNITTQEYLSYINNAFMAMHGPTHSFLCKDYLDHRASLEPLGLAPSGSTPVQLVRNYSFGASYTRDITKPMPGVLVFQNGVLKPGTVDALTGLFTPTTGWTPGATLTWTGEFRVPVRFDQMSLPSTIDNRSGENLISNGSVSLIEVIGE